MTKRKILAYLVAVLSIVLTVVSVPVIQPIEASKAYAALPTSVNLANSHAVLASDGSATLTATADSSVSGTGHYIQVWRTSPTFSKLRACSTGTVCTTTTNVTAQALKNSEFKAVVVSGNPTTYPSSPLAQSQAAAITRAAFSVNLSSSTPRVSTTETATLQAVTNQSVSSTGLRIFIYDKTTGSIVKYCSSGSSCVADVGSPNNASRDFKAYVATTMGGKLSGTAPETPVDEEASSSVITVNRDAFTLELTTTTGLVSTEEEATLTATANQTVQGTNFRIFIYNRTKNRVEQVCSGVATCSFATGILGEPTNNFVAYVATSLGGRTSAGNASETTVGEQAQSSQVTVDRKAWTVQLNASKDVITTDTTSLITATVNQPITDTDYRIYLYDRTLARVMEVCFTGTYCSTEVNFKTSEPHDYVAYISKDMNGTKDVSYYHTWPALDNPGGLQAESNEFRLTRKPFEIDLTTDKVVLDSQETANVTARLNQEIDSTGYQVFIYNRTTKKFERTCSIGAECILPYKLEGYRGEILVAYLAKNVGGKTSTANTTTEDVPTDLQAQSKILRMTSKQWHISLRGGSTLTAKTNMSVSNSRLEIFIVNKTDQYIREVCDDGTSCSYTPTETEDGDEFVAYVAQSIGGYSSPFRLYSGDAVAENMASSNGFSANMGSGYYDRPFEPESIGTATPQVCSCQIGDPINLQTGALTEAFTDLSVTDRGYALHHDRSYDSKRADQQGSMGYGWTFRWDARIDEDANGNAVVRFDDWSEQMFENANGDYEAVYYSSDVLTKTYADGQFSGWKLTRKNNEQWLFNPLGKLFKVQNEQGKYLEASYSSTGSLSSVESSSGQRLSYTTTSGRITSVTSPGGRTINYGYDGANNLTRVTYEDGTFVSYGYDANHWLTTLTNRRGNTNVNAFDSSGRVVEQTNALNETTTIAYGEDYTQLTYPSGLVERKVFQDGLMTMNVVGYGRDDARVWTYTYDPLTLNVKTITNPYGDEETYSYDQLGNRVSKISFAGEVSSWTYDQDGRPLNQTLPNGTVQTFSLDSVGQISSIGQNYRGTNASSATTYGTGSDLGLLKEITDATGRTTNFEYDVRGNKTSETGPGSSNRARTEHVYDADGRLTSTVDAYGTQAGATASDHTVNYSYDEEGRVVQEVAQDGATYGYVYDAQGNVVEETDPVGLKTTYTYDALDRPVEVITPDGVSRSLTYDEAGQVASMTDAAGNSVTYSYDIYGNAVEVTTDEGRSVEVAYDLLDRATTVTDGRGGTETMAYDAGSRLLTHEGATGGLTTYGYNVAGELATTTDPSGNVTTYGYDELGQATQVNFADSNSVNMNYDPEGRLLARTNELGNQDAYSFNDRGELATIEDELQRATNFSYDISGRLTKATLADGVEVSYGYDRVGRVTSKNYSDSTPAVTYTYDLAGKPRTMTDGVGTTTYGYDSGGRLNQVTDSNGSVTAYSHDNLGRIASVTYPSGYGSTRGYDNDGLLTSVTDSNGEEITFTYDETGALSSIAYPNAVTETLVRDLDGQVSQITVANELTTLTQWDYNVLPSGKLSSVTDSVLATTRNFGYDARNRLTSGQGQGYGYDASGRITALASGDTLSYNAADELTEKRGAGGALSTEYDYDAVGNRVSEVAGNSPTNYQWDAENRLTRYEKGASTPTTYSYDGDGLRMGRSTGQQNEEFVWDRFYENAELLEDGSHTYLYGPNGIPLAQVHKVSGEYSFFHLDSVGSVRVATDDAGLIIGEASFTPYGELIGASSTGTKFGFAGEYTDATGLIYLRARYYDPATSQFLTVDPLYQSSWDRYGYASGDPFMSTDPSGLMSISEAFAQMQENVETLNQIYEDAKQALKDAYQEAQAWAKKNQELLSRIGTTVAVAGAVACVIASAGVCTVLVIAGAGLNTGMELVLSPECFTVKGALTSLATNLLVSRIPGFKVAKAAKTSKSTPTSAGSTPKSSPTFCANSFEAETLVLMGDGRYRKIKDLRTGDRVMAKDERTGKVAPKRIEALIRGFKTQAWSTVEFSDGSSIDATDNHPFWEPELREWVAAGDLVEGSQVEAVDGATATVTSIRAWTALQRSYNLTVNDYSTYFVTRGDIWVHNCPNGHNKTGVESSDPEAKSIAKNLGFNAISERGSRAKIFESKRGAPNVGPDSSARIKYITRDIDPHGAGYWKGFNTLNDAKTNKNRLGTYCQALCTWERK